MVCFRCWNVTLSNLVHCPGRGEAAKTQELCTGHGCVGESREPLQHETGTLAWQESDGGVGL